MAFFKQINEFMNNAGCFAASRACIRQRKKNLDDVFLETYGVLYSHIILVLYVLSKMELPPADEFPVYVMKRNQLIDAIRSNVIINIIPDTIDKTISFLTLRHGVFHHDKFLYFGAMLRNRERITLSPLIELQDGSIIFGRECIDGTMILWNDVLNGHIPYKIEQNSNLNKLLKAIQKANGKLLEKNDEEKAVHSLSRNYVEARIDNFKRLSKSFNKREPCGEIDLLCVNPTKKIVFVFDCKSLTKIPGIYQVKRNIEEFFFGKDSYLKKLKRKTEFIEKNLVTILEHFGLVEIANWEVKGGFVVTKVHFAAFYKGDMVDFIDLEELKGFIL